MVVDVSVVFEEGIDSLLDLPVGNLADYSCPLLKDDFLLSGPVPVHNLLQCARLRLWHRPHQPSWKIAVIDIPMSALR
jgi:hypothetical protein